MRHVFFLVAIFLLFISAQSMAQKRSAPSPAPSGFEQAHALIERIKPAKPQPKPNVTPGRNASLTVCVTTSDGGGGNLEKSALAASLTALGFNVVLSNDPAASGCAVFVSHPGSNFLEGIPALSWVNNGGGYVQISDWGSNYIDNAGNYGYVDFDPVTVTTGSPTGASTDGLLYGLPASWTSFGFWINSFGGYIGGAIDPSLPNLASTSSGPVSFARSLTGQEQGNGRLVYIGFNVYGSLAGCEDLQVLQNAVLWAGQQDPASAGPAPCSADPCANDTEAPSISCPGIITPAVLDPNNCTNALPDYRPFVSVSDNCDEAPALSQSPAPGTVITGVQTVTVTVTATDASGNSNSCTYTVPHVDVTPPNPVCRTTTVYINPYGYYSLEYEDVLDFGLTSDNCGEVYVTSLSQYYVDCSEVGSTLPVTVNVEDESGNPASCTAMITVEKGTDLPEPWDSDDIGNPGPGNSYAYDPCEYEFTIGAGANNNSLGSDNMAFIEKSMCGDFEITAQVISITPNGYAGLMARESDAAGSKMVGLYTNHTNLMRWEARTVANGAKVANFFLKPAPYWVRLVRQGNWFYGYYSFNGVNFSIVTAQQLSMNECLEIGMAAFSNIPGSTATAVFGNVDCGGEEEGPGIIQLPDTEAAQAGIGRTISLFPNPARDVVTVEMGVTLNPGLKSGDRCPTVLRLRNELGQLLEERRFDEPAERIEWNVSQLRPGLYFLEIIEEGQAPQVLRFVKASS